MNRRDTIKTLMAASGSLVALPGWADAWQVQDVASSPPLFSIAGQQTLAAVADTIIPKGNSVGALSVGVDKFLEKLFADCYEEDVRNNIKVQLEFLEKSAADSHGKSFSDCDQSQRETMLLGMATSDDKSQSDFFKLVKSETIRGFNTSREVMVNYHRFRQVPGHYYGCVDVNT